MSRVEIRKPLRFQLGNTCQGEAIGCSRLTLRPGGGQWSNSNVEVAQAFRAASHEAKRPFLSRIALSAVWMQTQRIGVYRGVQPCYDAQRNIGDLTNPGSAVCLA